MLLDSYARLNCLCFMLPESSEFRTDCRVVIVPENIIASQVTGRLNFFIISLINLAIHTYISRDVSKTSVVFVGPLVIIFRWLIEQNEVTVTVSLDGFGRPCQENR